LPFSMLLSLYFQPFSFADASSSLFLLGDVWGCGHTLARDRIQAADLILRRSTTAPHRASRG
ncbi:hypothetical protein PENTCL1PPCAC_714, partial [Pristionchus entomophagus]